jgi:hypothetical protein
MSSTTQPNCPVVGTTNTTLPPSHPDVDLSRPGQTCPVVGATTDHHADVLHKHPRVPSDTTSPTASTGTTTTTDNAAACPVLSRKTVNEPQSRAMDDGVCPVVGTATTVLPPDHPAIADGSKEDGAVCPMTKATVGHHRGKLHGHPDVGAAAAAGEGKVCPVTGASAA